jgi:hemolysin III
MDASGGERRPVPGPAGAVHSHAEERASYLTHGAGVLFSLIAVSLLLKVAAARSAVTLLACSAYGLTLVLMFASSTAYHAVPLHNERVKRALRTLDHSAIFLLIAGTYTALSLAVPKSAAAFALLAGVWLLSALGVVALVRRGGHRPGGPLVCYLALSALVALALPALSGPLGARGVWLLSVGGVMYALGVPFYLARRMRYHHVIWHGFVLVASALHFLVVIRYVVQG